MSRGWTRDARPWCPQGPARTRLARRCQPHTAGPARLLAAPPGVGVAASDGMAWRPPRRHGRNSAQGGQNGQRHPRGLVGGPRGLRLPPWGLLGAWAWAPAQVQDTHWPALLAQGQGAGPRLVVTETGGHAQRGAPVPRTVGPRGPWNTCLRGGPVVSRRTTVVPRKQMGHRGGASCRARVAWTRAVLHRLARWGRARDEQDLIRLSIAAFSL